MVVLYYFELVPAAYKKLAGIENLGLNLEKILLYKRLYLAWLEAEGTVPKTAGDGLDFRWAPRSTFW